MAKIIHTGDIHLDSPFSTLSPEAAKLRRKSLRTIVSKIVDVANEVCADAIIFAGDLFDVYPIYAETAKSIIVDFSRTKTPIFITPGNHDPHTADSPYKTLSFPENVHIFTTPSLEAKELSASRLRIFGAAYTAPACDERLLDNFKAPDDDYVNIVILHSEIDCTRKYCPVSVEEIRNSSADYIAFGHIHKPSELMKSGKTFYAYCGIPEARDFGESYDTGICIIDITKDSIKLERRRISDIRYREITLDISDGRDVVSTLPPALPSEHIHLTLTGECTPPNIDALCTILSKNYAELIIDDMTFAPRDIWEGIREDTLRGIYLKKLKSMFDTCEDEDEKKKILLAAKLGIDAIENRDI